MTKLTKAHIKERDALASILRDKWDDLEKAQETFNGQVKEKLWPEVVSALDAYNEALSNANEWRDGIQTEIADYIADKSEKWREGDKGQQVENWLEQFENAAHDLEEIDLEEPEELDFLSDHENPAEIMEQLPESAEDC